MSHSGHQNYRRVKIGNSYGRLTAHEIIGKTSNGSNIWRCTCKCGTSHNVRSSHLTSGGVQSCGCLEREINVRQNLDTVMKKCSRCDNEKEWPTEFARKYRKSGIKYAGYCRECQNRMQLRSVNKKKDEYLEKGKLHRERLYKSNMRLIMCYLIDNPCVDCGESNPLKLQFDHVRGKKLFTISHAIRHRKTIIIMEEIEKCETRCASCHQIKTIIESGYLSWWLEENQSYIDTSFG